MADSLVLWGEARRAVEAARGIDELKVIRDKAEALRQYARQAKESLDVQNGCAEIKLRAERRMGEMLTEMPKQHGARPADNTGSQDVTPPELSDIGISKMQSSRYQSIARLPEAAFESHISEVIAQKSELTEAGVIAFVKQTFRAEDIARQRAEIRSSAPQLPKGEYDCIVIDPPWEYGNVDTYDPTHYMSRVSNPYPEMSLDAIQKLQIPTSENCVLWLWTTHKYLKEAFCIMEGWGFTYKATLVWNKESMGVGQWLRKQCEFCLLGIKGKPQWLANDVRDIITVQKTRHSKKPDEFYTLAEKCSEGRRLEMFARTERTGWDTWGNDTKKFESEAGG